MRLYQMERYVIELLRKYQNKYDIRLQQLKIHTDS